MQAVAELSARPQNAESLRSAGTWGAVGGRGGPAPAGREGLTPGPSPGVPAAPLLLRLPLRFPLSQLLGGVSVVFRGLPARRGRRAPKAAGSVLPLGVVQRFLRAPARLGSAGHGLASAEPGMLRESGCAVLLAAPLRFPQVPELNRGQRGAPKLITCQAPRQSAVNP